MRKLTAALAMVVAMSLMVIPVYAENTASDVITVNVAVEPWIEIALVDPNPLDLGIEGSSKATGSVEVTVKCNTNWSLKAHPEWGNFFGLVGIVGGTWSAPGHQPVANYGSSIKTSVDGDIVTIDIEVHANDQNNELLGPDDDGSFNIELLATAG